MAGNIDKFAVAEPTARRWTRDEYHRLIEEGFFDRQRVELVFGRIVQMAPQRNSHSVAVELVDRFVRRAFPNDRIRIQMPLSLRPNSEPEPDVAVVPGNPRDLTDHPSSAALVVEVSDTTLLFDRRQKARLYARNGIADYWILNLVEGRLEIHRDPITDGGARGGPAYRSVTVHLRDDTVSPLAAPDAKVTVADLLP